MDYLDPASLLLLRQQQQLLLISIIFDRLLREPISMKLMFFDTAAFNDAFPVGISISAIS